MNHKWNMAAAFLIVLYVSPYFILGEGAHVRTHDNLDSNVVWYKILAESGQIFAPNGTEIPNMLGGVPREAFGSELSVILWLFVLFPPFVAYVINEVIMRFVAFFGMYALLRRHVIRDTEPFVAAGVALAFSFLPFLPTSGLSFAGLPLVLYAFLNIRARGDTLKDWLILCVVPFYSSLVLTFAFFLMAMGVWWAVDGVRMKRLNGKWLAALALMGSVYLLVEYRLVYSTFFGVGGFTAHRVEFMRGIQDVAGAVELWIEDFLTAHTHDLSLHTYIILPAIVLALIIARVRGVKAPWLAGLLLFQLVLSFWYGFWYWEGLRPLKDTSELARTFNFARFHFLGQFLWYVAFALALSVMMRPFKWMKGLAIALILLQIGYVTYAGNPEIKYVRHDYLSYREFYSPELFQSVRDAIGRDPRDYRVVSIGMHPAIPQYSGFYTADGYLTMYPLAYKHAFRDVIAAELDKNESLQHYYDTWGSRCYVFVDELGKNYEFTKDEEKAVDDLELDAGALKELGVDYVLSAVEIHNSEENRLRLMDVFEHVQSPWRIYVYEVLPPGAPENESHDI